MQISNSNDNFFYIKVDWLCGQGVDAVCVRRDEHSKAFLIEFKESENRLVEAIRNIENTLRNMRDKGAIQEILVVYSEAGRRLQQYESKKQLIMEKYKVIIREINEIQDPNNELLRVASQLK